MTVSRSNLFLEASHKLLREGYGVRFCAGGQSMFPTICDGEMITVEPVKITAIRRGDILLYRFKKGVIAHRVVSVEKADGGEPIFILRGDAIPECDAPVEASKILGRIIAVERDGRLIPLSTRRAKLARAARVAASSVKKKLSRS